jgi:hypothetical protein
MKQTGINHSVEREAETGQRERIDESEIDSGPALERFAPRKVNRRVGCINRTDIMTQTGEIERIFPVPQPTSSTVPTMLPDWAKRTMAG